MGKFFSEIVSAVRWKWAQTGSPLLLPLSLGEWSYCTGLVLPRFFYLHPAADSGGYKQGSMTREHPPKANRGIGSWPGPLRYSTLFPHQAWMLSGYKGPGFTRMSSSSLGQFCLEVLHYLGLTCLPRAVTHLSFPASGIYLVAVPFSHDDSWSIRKLQSHFTRSCPWSPFQMLGTVSSLVIFHQSIPLCRLFTLPPSSMAVEGRSASFKVREIWFRFFPGHLLGTLAHLSVKWEQ